MRNTRNIQPTIVVTDAGRGSAVSMIRSLGRHGFHVIAADAGRLSAGMHSRYAGERLVYPDPFVAPGRFAGAMLDLVQDRAIDLLIPTTDAAILPLLDVRAAFEKHCRLALPSTEALAVTMDKAQTVALATALNVPLPKTCVVETAADALAAQPELGWPVVLKPQVSRLYRENANIVAFTVSYAADRRQLAEQMRQFEGLCPVLLQEYCGGDGIGIELLMHEGDPLAAFQHRRLREVPITGGASALRESVPVEPELLRHAVNLLSALKWTGLAMVEFKHGRSGPRLMEINGRIWGSLPLAVLSGMDFPLRLANLLLYGPPAPSAAPDTSYAIGTRARNLNLEITWILSVLRGGQRYPFLGGHKRREGVRALAQLADPRVKFDVQSASDPAPGLIELAAIAARLFDKATSRRTEAQHHERSVKTHAGDSRQQYNI